MDSIILDIRNGQTIAKNLRTIKYALEFSQATKGVIIHEILLYCANQQSLEHVIKHLDEAIKSRVPIYQYEELNALLNFQDDMGNTLLHYVVSHGQHKDIMTLIKYDANPLIKNRDGKIPLDLAQGKAKEVLIESMIKQAKSKKEGAGCDALERTFAVGFLTFIVFGVGVSIAAQYGVVSFPNGVLGLAIASPIAGIAVGLITYFLDHDRK